MTEREFSDINRALGGLQATVSHLMTMWEHNDRDATEGRRTLHKKFDELKDATTASLNSVENKVSQINGRVDSLTEKIGEMKPSIIIHDQERQQSIGSKKTVAVVWGVIVAIISGTTAVGVEIVHTFWGGSPPHH